MRLYFFPVAPNPTRVRLYLAEKAAAGHDFGIEQVLVDLTKEEQKSEAHLARNPLGNLPVLELDDGSNLTESRVIMSYLEALQPEPSLMGEGLRDRTRVEQLERIAEMGPLFAISIQVHATRSPLGLAPIPEMAEFFREQGVGPLKLLDDCLSDGRPFLAGEGPTIADCTLAAALQFGRFGQIELDPAFEHLTRWDREYRAREVAADILVL